MNLAAMRVAANVFALDQYIYEVKGADGGKAERAFGRFNRAQRAYQNYHEYLPINIMNILLGGFVYPREVMIISILYIGLRRLEIGVYPKTRGAIPLVYSFANDNDGC